MAQVKVTLVDVETGEVLDTVVVEGDYSGLHSSGVVQRNLTQSARCWRRTGWSTNSDDSRLMRVPPALACNWQGNMEIGKWQ